MRIAVTGGSGKLGRAVVDELLAHDHDVINLDRVPPTDDRAEYTRVDFTDLGQTAGALTAVDDRHDGLDAVVHLAAIPGPGMAPNATIFANNVISTYNVFEAARMAKVRNVVWASSETVLGLPFDEPPVYVPVDEEVPLRPASAYSLGKTLDEEMARQFCRWDPEAKMIALRFSNVMEPSDYAGFEDFQGDATVRKWNLWSYIDARDGAQAVRRALDLDATGFDVFIIASPDTVMRRPNAELLAEVFPDVPQKRPIEPNETLLSIDKARRVLGYAPRHSWRDAGKSDPTRR
jgi:nucleoside-diphosphate-sugar epimerase